MKDAILGVVLMLRNEQSVEIHLSLKLGVLGLKTAIKLTVFSGAIKMV